MTTLRLSNHDDDLDPALLDEIEHGVIWEASVETYNYTHRAPRVILHRLIVVRETPKGVWYTRKWGGTKRWRSRSSRKHHRTRRGALLALERRKLWHVKHERRRMRAAEDGLRATQAMLERLGMTAHPARPLLLAED